MLYCYRLIITLSAVTFLSFIAVAQGQSKFLEQRAEEDYHYLKDSTDLVWPKAIKYLALDKQKESYLSIGGSFRPRFEHFTNNRWIDDNDQNYYTQRLAFHASVHIGKNIRFFGELQHGYKTDGAAFLQTDDLDVHQAFVTIQTSGANPVSIRFGRQEMKLGIGRLVDLRVGPNVRRAFDMGRITLAMTGL